MFAEKFRVTGVCLAALLVLSACGQEENPRDFAGKSEYAAYLESITSGISPEERVMLLDELAVGFEAFYMAHQAQIIDLSATDAHTDSVLFERAARPALNDLGFLGVRKLGLEKLVEETTSSLAAVQADIARSEQQVMELQEAAVIMRANMPTITLTLHGDEAAYSVKHDSSSHGMQLVDVWFSYPRDGTDPMQQDAYLFFEDGIERLEFTNGFSEAKLEALGYADQSAITLHTVNASWQLSPSRWPAAGGDDIYTPYSIDIIVEDMTAEARKYRLQADDLQSKLVAQKERLSSIGK